MELTDEARQRALDEWAPIIDDPLAWQRQMDATGLSINMRGSARFWYTVMARYELPVLYRDGAPDITCLVIALDDTIALELKVEGDWPYIRYRFVSVAEAEARP